MKPSPLQRLVTYARNNKAFVKRLRENRKAALAELSKAGIKVSRKETALPNKVLSSDRAVLTDEQVLMVSGLKIPVGRAKGEGPGFLADFLLRGGDMENGARGAGSPRIVAAFPSSSRSERQASLAIPMVGRRVRRFIESRPVVLRRALRDSLRRQRATTTRDRMSPGDSPAVGAGAGVVPREAQRPCVPGRHPLRPMLSVSRDPDARRFDRRPGPGRWADSGWRRPDGRGSDSVRPSHR